MQVEEAQSLLEELEEVRLRTRNDRRGASLPLLTFGVLAAVDAAVRAWVDPADGLYWLAAAPAGLAFAGWRLRRREAAVGVGTGSESYTRSGLALLVVLLLVPVLLLFGAPLALAGVALGVIGLRRQHVRLVAWGLVIGCVGVLDGFRFLENRLYEVSDRLGLFEATNGYFDAAPAVVALTTSAVLVAAGLVARRHETS